MQLVGHDVIPGTNWLDHQFDCVKKTGLGLAMKRHAFVRFLNFFSKKFFQIYLFSVKTCSAIVIPFYGMALCKNYDLNFTIDYSPRNETFMKNYSVDVQKFTENFAIDTECEFSCALGFYLVGSSKRHCLPLSKWDGLQASCKRNLCSVLFLISLLINFFFN